MSHQGCEWCAYEIETRGGNGSIQLVKPATVQLKTDKGLRHLCDEHAIRGHWNKRARRVGAVA